MITTGTATALEEPPMASSSGGCPRHWRPAEYIGEVRGAHEQQEPTCPAAVGADRGSPAARRPRTRRSRRRARSRQHDAEHPVEHDEGRHDGRDDRHHVVAISGRRSATTARATIGTNQDADSRTAGNPPGSTRISPMMNAPPKTARITASSRTRRTAALPRHSSCPCLPIPQHESPQPRSGTVGAKDHRARPM